MLKHVRLYLAVYRLPISVRCCGSIERHYTGIYKRGKGQYVRRLTAQLNRTTRDWYTQTGCSWLLLSNQPVDLGSYFGVIVKPRYFIFPGSISLQMMLNILDQIA